MSKHDVLTVGSIIDRGGVEMVVRDVVGNTLWAEPVVSRTPTSTVEAVASIEAEFEARDHRISFLEAQIRTLSAANQQLKNTNMRLSAEVNAGEKAADAREHADSLI